YCYYDIYRQDNDGSFYKCIGKVLCVGGYNEIPCTDCASCQEINSTCETPKDKYVESVCTFCWNKVIWILLVFSFYFTIIITALTCILLPIWCITKDETTVSNDETYLLK